MSDFYKKYSIEVSAHGILYKANSKDDSFTIEFIPKHTIEIIRLSITKIEIGTKGKVLPFVSSDNIIVLEEIYKYIMENLYEINI